MKTAARICFLKLESVMIHQLLTLEKYTGGKKAQLTCQEYNRFSALAGVCKLPSQPQYRKFRVAQRLFRFENSRDPSTLYRSAMVNSRKDRVKVGFGETHAGRESSEKPFPALIEACIHHIPYRKPNNAYILAFPRHTSLFVFCNTRTYGQLTTQLI
jgi:hypothetical protein